MASWNSRADWLRALWVLAAVPAWAAGGVAGLFVGAVVGDALKQYFGYVPPPLPVAPQGFAGFVLEFGGLLFGIFGPLVTLVAAGLWRWRWRRTLAATLAVGLVAAVAALVGELHPKRFSLCVMFAHVGLYCGLAGGFLAWVRARVGRSLAGPVDGDDDP